MHNVADLSGGHRVPEPPDPIPNSEVKRCIADGSAGSPRVRVGHRQAFYFKARTVMSGHVPVMLLSSRFFLYEFGCLLVARVLSLISQPMLPRHVPAKFTGTALSSIAIPPMLLRQVYKLAVIVKDYEAYVTPPCSRQVYMYKERAFLCGLGFIRA